MLEGLAARLTPAGLPEWVGLAVLALLLLLALCVALMPFSVFGVKARLDAIEAQLDELRAEIRGLSVRLSERGTPRDWSGGADVDLPAPAARPDTPLPATQPPLPRGGRNEPRITWPRG
ncbi:hypothetical protein ACI6QG_04295 [Roseococcus sp. DSY-14]|uniref:hypothetical protein n=1 Tax=Roseococcus sp. DSY-14 TaxID=3369650 RepID=UPI00387ABF4D